MAEWDLKGLFLAYRPELEVYLTRKVRCRETALDLLQETFLRFAQQPAEAGPNNARAYLYRTAHNLAVDHFRQTERRQTYPMPLDALDPIPDDAPPVDRALEGRQRLRALQDAMAELPPRTREVFELSRIEGLTYLEVAQRLDISESSVQKHLAKALVHAMQRLKSP